MIFPFSVESFNSKSPSQSIGNLSWISLEKLFSKSTLINKLNLKKDDKNAIKKISNKNITKKSQFKLSRDVVIGSGGFTLEGEDEIQPDEQSLFHIISIEK